jgi:protein gp37
MGMGANQTSRTTGIEWTDHTWNPIVGCTMRSAGCRNCYAQAMAARLEGMGNPIYAGLTKPVDGRPVWTGEVRLNSDRAFRKPETIKRPSVIFVNSMSDVFHDAASDDTRVAIWQVMRRCPHHTFQILTKRPENVHGFFRRTGMPILKNVWLGATVEDDRVRNRIPIVREFPAAVRFLSVEPLIAPLSITVSDLGGIDWVITGGESGPGARPMEPRWLRVIRDACIVANVPHFFKQWGTDGNNPLYASAPAPWNISIDRRAAYVRRVDPIGKGGSLIDGRPWKQFPAGTRVVEVKE